MSITGALANANSGLAAASKRADVVSNNVANALTEGYSRREVSVAEQVLGDGSGAGVSVIGVTRADDPVVTREKRSAGAVMERDQAIASAYSTIDSALGDDSDAYSLFGQYQALETALQDLSDTPESVAAQASTLDSAKSLATTLNRLSGDAQKARESAEQKIAADVGTVNKSLKQIESLNKEIAKAAAGHRETASLEDQRKSLIDQVSSIIPVRELDAGAGQVDLITNEGVYLLSGTAKTIDFTQKGVITADLSYSGGTLSGLSVGGTDITPGGSSNMAVRQGSLAGQFAVRDQVMPEYQEKLDSLARDLMERFEGIDATQTASDPGLFTDAGAAFDPLKEAGLASRIAVNTVVDPSSGGALWRLRDGLGATTQGPTSNATFITTLLDSFTAARGLSSGAGLSGTYSATGAAAGISSLVGSARVSAQSSLATSSARATAASDAEKERTAVDSDQELQKLILIEQAYAANAKVIKTAQSMIDVLMGL